MCLYPRLIKNPKYKKNNKNGGIIPAVPDPRVLYVPIGCGNCIECRKKKARDWQVRLLEEVKQNNTGKFITLTFSNKSICDLIKKYELTSEGYELDNKLATISTRLFLERWRKTHKKTLRHWLVTELGHEGTENIHLHGIVFTNKEYEVIEKHWQYGFIWPTKEMIKHTYVSERTVNYITKYITKIDFEHPNYKPIILTSPGIGNCYTKESRSNINKFKDTETNETYRTNTGHKISLPIYYRNKLYTDEEREKLWLNILDKNERWICGEKVKADNTEEYFKLLKWYRDINKKLGYGDNRKDWDKQEYEKHQRTILYAKRTK